MTSASRQHLHHGQPDSEFATKAAAAGNLAEIALERLGTERASSSDVKQFAQRMIGDHSRALDALRSVASQKSLVLPDPAGNSEQSAESKSPGLSGAEFDREFT